MSAYFKEVKDLQKARDDVKMLQEKYTFEVAQIESLKKESERNLEKLEKRFENEAQTIMYATYYIIPWEPMPIEEQDIWKRYNI